MPAISSPCKWFDFVLLKAHNVLCNFVFFFFWLLICPFYMQLERVLLPEVSLQDFLWCSQSGDHSQNHLAKFGYMLDVKVEKRKGIVLYSLELIIKIWWFAKKTKKSSKSGNFTTSPSVCVPTQHWSKPWIGPKNRPW